MWLADFMFTFQLGKTPRSLFCLLYIFKFMASSVILISNSIKFSQIMIVVSVLFIVYKFRI